MIEDRQKLPEQFAWAQGAISRFQSQLEPLAAWFRAQAAPEQLTAPLAGIVHSLAHIHVKRLMLTDPREQEMIVYAYLNRAHQSRHVRAVDGTRAAKLG